MKTGILLGVLMIATGGVAEAQTQRSVSTARVQTSGTQYHLNWEGIRTEEVTEDQTLTYLYFKGAAYHDSEDLLPRYSLTQDLRSGSDAVSVQMRNARFEPLSNSESRLLETQGAAVGAAIEIDSRVAYYRKQPVAQIEFLPIRKNPGTGLFEKLVDFDLTITPRQDGTGSNNGFSSRSGGRFSTSSVLGDGDWYKIAVVDNGIHKIDYAFLQSMGIDMSTVDPNNIRIFGNGGGMLPIINSDFRHDDLQENAIHVEGAGDGVFNAEDYILFYGEDPHRWVSNGWQFSHEYNLFSDTTFYFLTTNYFGASAKRIAMGPTVTNPVNTVSTFDEHLYYERDLVNLIHSGSNWYAEVFDATTTYEFKFAVPNVITDSLARVQTKVCAQTIGSSSSFSMDVGGQASTTESITGVSSGYTAQYARNKTLSVDFVPSSSNFDVRLDFNKGLSTARGWLDDITITARRQLIMVGDQMSFRDQPSVDDGNATFRVGDFSPIYKVWDVTDPVNVFEVPVQMNGGNGEFVANTDSLKEYVAFSGNYYYTPEPRGKVVNQNLHALGQVKMVIIAHPDFLTHAEALAEHHRNFNGLTVHVVTPQQIYNEFSSGAQDITAIKDFMRMFYTRAGSDPTLLPEYLLLFGDGSYDLKNRVSGNTNFIPSYHSTNSLQPTGSYVSDDYFGLLDDNEGQALTDIVDIGIGRFPVSNRVQAQNAVNKIMGYDQPNTLGPWRNVITFLGDDEDANIHMRDANKLASFIDTTYPWYSIERIFLDAYKQESTPGGERYPDVNAAITSRMNQGGLVMNYIGHGGELGWAHERILEVPEINSWENTNLPLFVTATCEFSRFDDPKRTSGGEYVFLNPRGGGIGLLTTTRLVYSSPNFEIAKIFGQTAYVPLPNGEMPRLGDIVRETKVQGPKNVNSRNFTLLGDPAVRLSYPEHRVITTFMPDTIQSLSKVTVRGYVADIDSNKLTDFNGRIYPLIFDKAKLVQTLNNNGTGVFNFMDQKNVIFSGKASVTNGEFEFSFIVPKDISITKGNGRVSYYAENGLDDATGNYEDFVIGGISDNAGSDKEGPDVQLFMNDENFVFGGITDQDPDLFALVYDSNGINTVGNGIGHDIVAVLDENSSQSIVLNDYYESDLDSYQSGSIRYPLSKLSNGKHTLRLKVWDVFNNSGEANTEFVVAENATLALDHILNYPNPFTTNTAFFFEHNQAGQNLDVRIQIFTVSGKLVKVIDGNFLSDGFRVGPIEWDGRDTYGDKIGRGVYVYKLKVTAPSGESADEFEKLVILN